MNKVEKIKNRMAKDINKIVNGYLRVILGEAKEEIIQMIMDEYDIELSGAVTDRNSKTNPSLYRDEFLDRLMRFEFLETNGDTVSLNMPTTENFNFSGRLKVIQTIMEGLIGLYVEINEEDYVSVFGKKPVNQDPVDEYVRPKDQIYIVRYNGRVQRAERDLNKKFVRYPFSNSPPIDIFDTAEEFVDNNINGWINKAIKLANKTFVNNYRGAKL